MSVQPSPAPIIVRIIEGKKDTMYDVVFRALGLTGVLVVLAVAAAVVLGAALFWVRRPKGSTAALPSASSSATSGISESS